MLKGVDPLLGPNLLRNLRAMGHGDEIAIVDANFPAEALARRLERADGVDSVRMAEAIASVLPIDDFVAPAAWCMEMVDAPGTLPPLAEAFGEVLRRAGHAGPIGGLARQAFYERARGCFAIVATGERRLYGNLILTKGVVR